MPDHSRDMDELARFLRTRRARVDPTDAGFPVGPRRRSKGLRREEVAVLAGLSPTWYTYLEQGRDIRPSPQVLNSLARVLRLTEDERRYLHILAYGHVEDPRPLDTEIPPHVALEEVIALTDYSSYPLYAGNQYGDLIAWNHAATEWYDDWGRLPLPERNIMRWLLIAPKARESLVDWEADTREVVARWRTEVAKNPNDGRLKSLIAELYKLSPEFARWWEEHDVREHRSQTRRLRHPRIGMEVMRIVVMRPIDFPSCAVAFHIPLNQHDSFSSDRGK